MKIFYFYTKNSAYTAKDNSRISVVLLFVILYHVLTFDSHNSILSNSKDLKITKISLKDLKE